MGCKNVAVLSSPLPQGLSFSCQVYLYILQLTEASLGVLVESYCASCNVTKLSALCQALKKAGKSFPQFIECLKFYFNFKRSSKELKLLKGD